MNINERSLVMITVIVSVTLTLVIGLIRNTNMRLDLRLGEDKALTIEGKKSHSHTIKTKVDCLPGEENSQPSNCDS